MDHTYTKEALPELYSEAVLRMHSTKNAIALMNARKPLIKSAEKEIIRDGFVTRGEKVTEARLDDLVNTSEAITALIATEEELRNAAAEAESDYAFFSAALKIATSE